MKVTPNYTIILTLHLSCTFLEFIVVVGNTLTSHFIRSVGLNPGSYMGKVVDVYQCPTVCSAESSPADIYWFPLSLKLPIMI